MTALRRMSMFFSGDQLALLRAESKETGVPYAEIVRRAIQEHYEIRADSRKIEADGARRALGIFTQIQDAHPIFFDQAIRKAKRELDVVALCAIHCALDQNPAALTDVEVEQFRARLNFEPDEEETPK